MGRQCTVGPSRYTRLPPALASHTKHLMSALCDLCKANKPSPQKVSVISSIKSPEPVSGVLRGSAVVHTITPITTITIVTLIISIIIMIITIITIITYRWYIQRLYDEYFSDPLPQRPPQPWEIWQRARREIHVQL